MNIFMYLVDGGYQNLKRVVELNLNLDVDFGEFPHIFFKKMQNAPICKMQTGAKEILKV